MTTVSHDWRLFGLDLSAVPGLFGAAFRALSHSQLLGWLHPEVPVQCTRADGQTQVWLSGPQHVFKASAPARTARFVAIELPEELSLRRQITLPRLSDKDFFRAVELEVMAVSPFSPDDLVWGYRKESGPNGVVVDCVLASKRQVEAFLSSSHAPLASGGLPEVWAFFPAGSPALVGGFGEGSRLKFAKRRFGVTVALLAFAFGLAAAWAVTPTAQLRLQAVQAVQAYDEAVTKAQPALAARAQLAEATDQWETLKSLAEKSVNPMQVLALLTDALPDDTYLQRLEADGTKVAISGQTADAAALMQRLGAVPGVSDVRAPSAATRLRGATQERFNIEFVVDSRALTAANGITTPASAIAAGAPGGPGAQIGGVNP